MTPQTSLGTADAPSSHYARPPQVEYRNFIREFSQRLIRLTEDGKHPVFTVDTGVDLWEVFLNSFTYPGERQFNNCNACHSFFKRYANLVVVDPITLELTPVFRPPSSRTRHVSPDFYKATLNVYNAVAKARIINGIFYTSDATLGTPENDGWHHFHLQVPSAMRWRSATQSASQRMAQAREDHRTLREFLCALRRGLHMERALHLLESGNLIRPEKALPHLRWLIEQYRRYFSFNRTAYSTFLYLSVATAPAGWCSPRSGILGSLIDFIAEGASDDAIARRWNLMLDPGHYRRPQAPPKVGTILTAQTRFAQLGLERSLERRVAALYDIPDSEAIWRLTGTLGGVAPTRELTGLFSDLATPAQARRAPQLRPVDYSRSLTWVKFAKEFLPKLRHLELTLSYTRHPLGSLTTAVFPEAPSILQWDSQAQRNPVAWYQYLNGSVPGEWQLDQNVPIEVLSIVPLPCHWYGWESPNFAPGVLLVLEDCRDARIADLALFPEILRSDLHEVRSVIEAHSRSRRLSRLSKGTQHAAGLLLRSGGHGWSYKLTGTDRAGYRTVYTIASWD